MIIHVICTWSVTWYVCDQPPDQCVMSHVISAGSITWSVHDQTRDQFIVATWSLRLSLEPGVFFRTMHGKTAPSRWLHSQGGVRRGWNMAELVTQKCLFVCFPDRLLCYIRSVCMSVGRMATFPLWVLDSIYPSLFHCNRFIQALINSGS